MKTKIILMMLCLMTLFPSVGKAQLGFDVASLEAYINDHKQQRSLLLVRSTLESSNKLLHDYSSEANVDYKNINKELDKYTRAQRAQLQISVAYFCSIGLYFLV